MTEPLGLLLAVMQPPVGMEEEFHDWYDTEHLPERAVIEGFLTARRFVCLDGFPRYAAAYDLSHHGVLQEPEYLHVSGERFSAWSKRMLSRVHGQARLEGPQIYPGTARYGDAGAPARIGLLRLRGMNREAQEEVVAGLRGTFVGRKDVLQLRVWRSEYRGDFGFAAMVEGNASFTLGAVDFAPLGQFLQNVDLANLYSGYWRRGTLSGVPG